MEQKTSVHAARKEGRMNDVRYRCKEAALRLGVDEGTILHFIEEEWIVPSDPSMEELDSEDIARCKLIHELQADFGVNEEAIPIILQLIDRIHAMELEAKKLSSARK